MEVGGVEGGDWEVEEVEGDGVGEEEVEGGEGDRRRLKVWQLPKDRTQCKNLRREARKEGDLWPPVQSDCEEEDEVDEEAEEEEDIEEEGNKAKRRTA